MDGRSDIYNLGEVYDELLCGERPFRGNKRMLLHQVTHEEPRPLRQINNRIPKNLETICLKNLKKEPPKYYQATSELADDLERFLAGEPIQARPIRLLQRW